MAQSDMFSQEKNRFTSLEEVIKALKRMKDDPLADAGTNIVISRGNSNARLLIIGEAPGPEENIKYYEFRVSNAAGNRWKAFSKTHQSGNRVLSPVRL